MKTPSAVFGSYQAWEVVSPGTQLFTPSDGTYALGSAGGWSRPFYVAENVHQFGVVHWLALSLQEIKRRPEVLFFHLCPA